MDANMQTTFLSFAWNVLDLYEIAMYVRNGPIGSKLSLGNG